MQHILSYVQIAVAIIIIVLILLQQRGTALGGAFGGGGEGGSSSYGTQRGFQKKIYWICIVLVVAFIILAVTNLAFS